MKKIYQVEGYIVYAHKILGYKVRIHETETSGVLVSVPMGQGADRIMFDKLVYFNKRAYWGKTRQEAIQNVRKWIRAYKKGVR
jgi:hypothetical protein